MLTSENTQKIQITFNGDDYPTLEALKHSFKVNGNLIRIPNGTRRVIDVTEESGNYFLEYDQTVLDEMDVYDIVAAAVSRRMSLGQWNDLVDVREVLKREVKKAADEGGFKLDDQGSIICFVTFLINNQEWINYVKSCF